MTIQNIIHQYDFNLQYAISLVADLNDPQMTKVPGEGLENHPAWTLGHLISGSAILAEDLGIKIQVPEDWMELFLRKGPGDPRKPDPDISKYPSKERLLSTLEAQHNLVKNQLAKIKNTDLDLPFQWRFSKFMPTLGDLIIFMCINHEAMHLGQLAAWRRAMFLPSALGGM